MIGRDHVVALILVVSLTSASAAAADQVPQHLAFAEQLFDQLLPENNAYGHPTDVRLKNGSYPAFNHSVCSTFLVALLKKADHYSDDVLQDWFKRPSIDTITAADIYTAFAAGRGAAPVVAIGDVQPGDLVTLSYIAPEAVAGAEEVDDPQSRNGSGHAPTGHLMIIDALPVKEEDKDSSSGYLGHSYDVSVLDCSRFPHGHGDSRTAAGAAPTGLGRGTIRLLTGDHDQIIGYTWTTLHTSIIYLSDRHPLKVVRLTLDSHP